MIYFDHNASTPLQPEALEIMLPYLSEHSGNPSSLHKEGRLTRHAIEHARQQVADLVGAQADQVIFTSGGTEANNLALKGTAWGLGHPGKIALSAIEHEAVLASAQRLETSFAWQVEFLPVDAKGRLELDALLSADIVSVMWANNETGVLQDIPQVAQKAKALGAWLHTDAVQAAGKVPINFVSSGADMMTLSAHKIGGPKGVGALILNPKVPLVPLIDGGGHEKGLRSGTENVAGIVGFGKAAELAKKHLTSHYDALKKLQTALEETLSQVPEVTLILLGEQRLPNTTMLSVAGVTGEMLVMHLDKAGFAVSGGAACGSDKGQVSHVLEAMGIDHAIAECAIRVSLAESNTEEEIKQFVLALQKIIDNLRS